MRPAFYVGLKMSAQISERDIQRLVRAFYKEVRQDEMLAPIFATKIGNDDWDKHMDHIADFWSSIFLKTRRFKGNPMSKHAALKDLTPGHFSHWLALFKDVSNRTLENKPKPCRLWLSVSDKAFKWVSLLTLRKQGKLTTPLSITGCVYRIKFWDNASEPSGSPASAISIFSSDTAIFAVQSQ